MQKEQSAVTGEGNAPREFPVRMSCELASYYQKCETQRDELLAELGGIHDALEHGDTVTIEPGSVKSARIRAAIAKVEGSAK